MDAQKPLRLTVKAKAVHLPLLLSSRFVRHFSTIVGVPVLAVRHGRQQVTLGCGVTAKFVGGNCEGRSGLRAQHLSKETPRCLRVLALLDEDLDEITILVDGTPEISALTLDRDDDFVEKPSITPQSHPLLDLMGIIGSKSSAPLTDSFVGDGYTSFGQEVFDVAEA